MIVQQCKFLNGRQPKRVSIPLKFENVWIAMLIGDGVSLLHCGHSRSRSRPADQPLLISHIHFDAFALDHESEPLPTAK
ncbi:hypothetical protein Pla22_35080 [Rubripirellula amarantea]|uniref:Uncharacterized protein n=1 Tax=Rubripirellula amarantea TaxID=2527999 RepID=A0A5C5WKV3_9BACT|nr:hypothetical protein Pla22_35080 [Rubripirellula amarantea]